MGFVCCFQGGQQAFNIVGYDLLVVVLELAQSLLTVYYIELNRVVLGSLAVICGPVYFPLEVSLIILLRIVLLRLKRLIKLRNVWALRAQQVTGRIPQLIDN
ncbi:MAG TPA: hypothetical protein VIV60_04735 [Polyangiaceae bacterium]